MCHMKEMNPQQKQSLPKKHLAIAKQLEIPNNPEFLKRPDNPQQKCKQ